MCDTKRRAAQGSASGDETSALIRWRERIQHFTRPAVRPVEHQVTRAAAILYAPVVDHHVTE